MERTINLSFRIGEELKKRLNVYCASKDAKIGETLNKIVLEHLEKENKKKARRKTIK